MADRVGSIFAMGRVWINPEAVLAFMSSEELGHIPMKQAAKGMKIFLDEIEKETLKSISDEMARESGLI